MKKNIKKGKITMIITMVIACFALALVMSMQFKIVSETDITSIENMREAELRTELANWKSKYEETETKYEETVAKIEEYKQTKQSNEETEKIVEQELEQVDLTLGKTYVQGEGIEVTLKDTEKLVEDELQQVNIQLGKVDMQGEGIEVTLRETDNEEISRITADDLILIVNALKASGAEAISINDERIVNMSDIVDINQSFIKINGQRIVSPYVIKAIGNQSYLESSLISNGGPVDEMKKIGQDVSVTKSNKVVVPKHNKEIKIKYMN